MNAIQHEDNSHSIFIEPGEIYLSDRLLGSDIFNGGGGGGVMGGAGGNMEEQDPELAEAIRMSLQDNAMSQPQQQQQPQNASIQEERQPTEEELEQMAIRLSLEEANPG